MQSVELLAYFPEERYSINGRSAQLMVTGEGKTMAIALVRAVRQILKAPEMKGKTPNYIWISVGAYGLHPDAWWRLKPGSNAEDPLPSQTSQSRP